MVGHSSELKNNMGYLLQEVDMTDEMTPNPPPEPNVGPTEPLEGHTEPEDGLTPEMRAIMDVSIFLAAAAKTIEPFNGLYAISLKTQAQGLLDLTRNKKDGCNNCCGGASSESPEVSAEVDSLVADIENMMKDS